MKQYLFIMLLLAMTASLYPQTDKRHYLGSHLSYGIASYSESRLTFSGNEKYEGKSYYSLGIDYTYRTSQTTDIGLGVTASIFQLSLLSTTYGVGGNSNSYNYEESLVMFSVPFFMKYRFGKYFYVSPGIRFNYHPDLGYSWGLGAFAGMGAEYTFTSGISLSITPQAHINMLSIGGVDESYNNFGNYDDKITGIGVDVKIGYWF